MTSNTRTLSEEMLGLCKQPPLVCKVRHLCKNAAYCCKAVQARRAHSTRPPRREFKVTSAVGQAQHRVGQRNGVIREVVNLGGGTKATWGPALGRRVAKGFHPRGPCLPDRSYQVQKGPETG